MVYFKDKISIVTGGGSGIGKALCEELGGRGAVVIVADINIEGAQKVASDIKMKNGQSDAAGVDVSQLDEVERLVDETVSKHGHLDYMFNNAGVTICGEVRDMELAHWQKLIDINLWGVIYGSTKAYKIMVEQGFGHIINIASLDGLMPMPMSAPYTAAKHGVVGLSSTLRLEGAELGVKVSVACPGAVDTGVLKAADFVGVEREGAIEEMSAFKMMNANDCARAILRGVEKNEGIILDGAFHNRLFWWLYRLNPNLYSTIMRMGVNEIRKHRIG
jgi:NAD(P)-dependent dehydrogenase (short-subunit alcohol dehydrogenase family)